MRPYEMRTTLLQLLAAVAIVLGVAAPAPAQAGRQRAAAEPVEIRWLARETSVGVALQLDIVVHSVAQVDDPILPTFEGGTLRLAGPRSTMRSTSIINGRVEESNTTTFPAQLIASAAGRLTVPPIKVAVDGQVVESAPSTIVVRERDASDDGVEPLLVDIVSSPESPLVGQPTTMTLRIWVRPFRDPTMNLRLDEQSMWQLIDLDRSSFGRFKQVLEAMGRRNQRPRGESQLRGDNEYYVYSLPMEYRASRPGKPELGDIDIELNVPTGVRVDRDIFDRRSFRVTGVRPVQARASLDGVEIRPLPTEGQPELFNGAVGRFTVSASAKPTEVSVGDPITVTYTVVSQLPDDLAALEELQAPPFASIPSLTESFRIPADPPAGTVTNRRKVFTQTFRPQTDDVSEIPPIPFAFYDPVAGEYSVVASQPIPITVANAERLTMSQIVGATPQQADAPQKALTAVSGGLLANVQPSEALLADASVRLGPLVGAAVALPPLACATAAVVLLVRRRQAADPARRRAARAERVALEALGRAPTAETVLAALTGYVADRCGLADGARTRADAVRALRDGGAPDELVAKADALLARCERERYAPSASGDVNGSDVRDLIRRLERIRLLSNEAEVGS